MVRQQNAKIDVLHNAVEDLKNELGGFKQIMAGVVRQFNDNFRQSKASVRQLHEGWVLHEAAIEKINERCTCGTYGSSDDEFETVNTVSTPSQVGGPVVTGGEGTWKPVITCWVHLELMCIFLTM